MAVHAVFKLSYATHATQRTHGLQSKKRNSQLTQDPTDSIIASVAFLCACIAYIAVFFLSVSHDQRVLRLLRCIRQLGNRPISPFS